MSIWQISCDKFGFMSTIPCGKEWIEKLGKIRLKNIQKWVCSFSFEGLLITWRISWKWFLDLIFWCWKRQSSSIRSRFCTWMWGFGTLWLPFLAPVARCQLPGTQSQFGRCHRLLILYKTQNKKVIINSYLRLPFKHSQPWTCLHLLPS